MDVSTAEEPAPGPAAPAPPDHELLARIETLLRIQALGPEPVLDFAVADCRIRLHLPFCATDVTQAAILKAGGIGGFAGLRELPVLVKPGATVVEVGSGIGVHTLILGMICRAGRVHAFEPGEVSFGILERNVTRNGLARSVTLHRAALGPAEGSAACGAFYPNDLGRMRLDLATPGPYRVTTLDAQKLEAVDLLRVDAGLAAPEVLAGAEETLRRCRPVVWLEVGQRAPAFAAAAGRLRQLGYRRTRALRGAAAELVFAPG